MVDHYSSPEEAQEHVFSIFNRVDQALAVHEIWRRAADDEELIGRMEHSYAGNSFWVIRFALRREVIRSFLSVWKNADPKKSVQRMADNFEDRRSVGLALKGALNLAEPARTLQEAGDKVILDFFDSLAAELSGREKGRRNRTLEEIVKLIRSYQPAGERHELLNRLGSAYEEEGSADFVGEFCRLGRDALVPDLDQTARDAVCLVRHMHNIGGGDGINNYAREFQRSRDARLFWSVVRGEHTSGHPEYRGYWVRSENYSEHDWGISPTAL